MLQIIIIFLKTRVYNLASLTLISLLFIACNSTKYVKDNQFLLNKNTVNIDGKKTSDPEITSYLIQRPNTRLIGLPVGLGVYNMGRLSYDSIHQIKLDSFSNRNNFLDKLLSKKQTLKILNRKKSINDWFLNKGESPVIIDPIKTNKSAQNLRILFFNKGYFKSKIKTRVLNDDKKADISYNIIKNDPFSIGDIDYKITSPSVKKTLDNNLKKLPLYKGQQYNLENFKSSISQITQTLRNKGFYHFNESLISFKEIDTLAINNITPVEIHIDNRKIKKGNEIVELPTNIQTIKNVTVYTDYTYKDRNQPYEIKKNYNLLDFYAHSELKYRTKILAKSIFIVPNKVYTDKNVELTRNHLRSLNNFKSVKINHIELPDNELATTITLTPQKKYGIGLNTEIIHSNIKQLGLSGGFSFINRNLFRGAEIFKLSLQGSVFDTSTRINGDNSRSFNAHEFGIDASLEFPRFIFPFLSNIIPRTMTPKTKVTIGTSFQRNIGLDKQKLSGIINYSWKSSLKNSHNIELLNLQFINNLNTRSYFNIYSSEFRKTEEIQKRLVPSFELTTENASSFINTINPSFANSNSEDFTTLKNIGKRQNIIVSNNIIPATSYSFEHNSRRGISDTRYNFFKVKVSSSGNLNSFFLKEKNKEKVFQNIAISEFVKIDVDFRKFWSRSNNKSLAYRAFVGAAIPTGKNKDIPFISSYFAGGSNDIRAWQTYDLGPGSSNSGLEFNIGNLKILTSLEYRFKIFNSIHGAVFADAGNIFNLPGSTTASKEEIFSNLKSLENIALGTGFGIRYDFNFLVLRLDLAFKTFEPYLNDHKWFSSYRLNDSVLNIGINYPF